MTLKTSIEDTTPEESASAKTWRLFRREESHGVGIGIAEFAVANPGADTMEMHDVPEAHYVLSGRGYAIENGTRVELRPGDALITLPGVRHTLVSEGDGPLVTIYVAIDSSKTSG